MLPIETFEQYKEYDQKGKNLSNRVTNCYFLPASIKKMIACQKLYVLEQKNMVLFLEKEPGFFRVYYYLSLFSEYDKLSLELPAVVEFVFNHELSDKQMSEIHQLEKLGFTLGRESGRMALDPDSLSLTQTHSEAAAAKPEDADAILRLLTENFNPLYAYIPTKKELLEAIHNGNVLVTYGKGIPIGVLFSETNKKTAVIRHLAVSKEYRSHGFAKQLVAAYHQKHVEHITSFSHWVDICNIPAIKLYQSFGYSFDGRKANEYVL